MDTQYNFLFRNEYLTFALLIAGSLVIAHLVRWLITRYFGAIIEKSSSKLDDQVLKIISKPLYFTIIITGVYLALHSLKALVPYGQAINRIFFIVIMIVAAAVTSRVLILFTSHWLTVEKRFEKTPRLVGKIITVLIYLVAFAMVLNYFDINVTPIIATLGVGGLAAGLALQSTLSNFFAGLHIITDRSFTVGDLIEINKENITGFIEDIGWRTTRIRTLTDTIAIVPNSKLAESIVLNTEKIQREMAVTIHCGVAYYSDLGKVEQVTLETARDVQQNTKGAVKTFEPLFRFQTFGESNIEFMVVLKIERYKYKVDVIHALIKNLKEKFEQEKIEISWPVRKIFSQDIPKGNINS